MLLMIDWVRASLTRARHNRSRDSPTPKPTKIDVAARAATWGTANQSSGVAIPQ